LVAGTYKATGTVKDTSGDTGSWGYSVTVTGTLISQVAPTSATTAVGKALTLKLEVSGAHGKVTYLQATGAAHLTVSSSGTVSTLAGLAVGTYKATGTVKDSLGDKGAWTFTVTVTAAKLVQIAPTTATTVTGKAFTGHLEVSGAHGTVTYKQATGSAHVIVSSSGQVSAPSSLLVGTYKATGSDKDGLGDSGTWSFTLTVTASEIDQIAPTTATTTPGTAFTSQLEVTGAHGLVTYAQTSGAPDLRVSPSGKVSAAANLVAGTYRATGTAKDSAGDTGTWSFALTVGVATIIQVAPTSATTTAGKAFTDQLAFSGAHRKVTYAQTDGAPALTVSSSGKISAPPTLTAGTYKAMGTAKDASGDAGAWSFALTVTATTLAQSAPTTASTTTGKAFSGQLAVSGSHGTLTFAELTGAPDLTVSSSGKVSAAASLVAGTYRATGTERDSLGDTGNWKFAVTVVATKLTQVAPLAARITTGKAFTGQLQVSGAHGTVTYAQSTGSAVLNVSSAGKLSTTASLVAGSYKATGIARDVLGDSGTWSFDLTIVATKLTQVAPDTARTTTGKGFTGQLQVSGVHGTVTYAQSTGGLDLKVSSSGKISAAASLTAGIYRAGGSARDTLGDTGNWSFVLTVVAGKLTQVAPVTASTTTGKAFTGQLAVSGAHGTVTYAQSTGSLDLKISSSGKISAAATLTAGTYKAGGTARDSLGDTGAWSFTLTVVAGKLTQVAPDTAVNKAGKAFSGQLKVSGAFGTVTYAQSTGAPHVKVSSSGKISAAAGLAAGVYKATGTAKDAYGDTGKWTFTLTVKGTKLTQISPTTGTTTAGKAFTTKLAVSGSHGTLTFTVASTGTQILSVTSSGTVLAPDIFTPGVYKITGIVKDSFGDVGTWSFVLIVEAAALPPG
jgi:lipoate synthase